MQPKGPKSSFSLTLQRLGSTRPTQTEAPHSMPQLICCLAGTVLTIKFCILRTGSKFSHPARCEVEVVARLLSRTPQGLAMSDPDEDLHSLGISFLGLPCSLQEVPCERGRQRGLDPADAPAAAMCVCIFATDEAGKECHAAMLGMQ